MAKKLAAKKNKKTHQHNNNLVAPEGGGEIIDVGKPEDFVPDTPLDKKADGDERDAKSEPTQAPLIPEAEIPVKVAVAVENNRMFATFVVPHLGIDKTGAKTLALEFSFPIVDAHRGRIPANVEHTYGHVLSGQLKRGDVTGVDAQTVDIFETSKSKKPALHLVEVPVLKPIVSEKEESGKGKTRNVIRFSFWLSVDFSYSEWALENFNKEFWLVMADSQASFA